MTAMTQFHDAAEVQVWGNLALGRLCAGGLSENIERVVAAGALDVVVSSLHRFNEHVGVQRWAIYCLGVLVDAAHVLHTQPACEKSVALLHRSLQAFSTHLHLQRDGWHALACLCVTNSTNARQAVDLGALELVLEGMKDEALMLWDIQACMCYALGAMCYDDELAKLEAADLHAVQAVVRTLARYMSVEAVAEWACFALSSLCHSSPMNAGIAFACGAMHAVIAVMQQFPLADRVQECAALAVAALCDADPRNQDAAAAEMDTVGMLLRSLQRSMAQRGVAERMAAAIAAVCYDHKRNAEDALTAALLSTMAAALRQQGRSSLVVDSSCMLLSWLIKAYGVGSRQLPLEELRPLTPAVVSAALCHRTDALLLRRPLRLLCKLAAHDDLAASLTEDAAQLLQLLRAAEEVPSLERYYCVLRPLLMEAAAACCHHEYEAAQLRCQLLRARKELQAAHAELQRLYARSEDVREAEEDGD
eukprot:PLAT3979.2.p1 GENE.PLAT3979.2~~PLAT3979.2.p1  ORF type:complete len:477 (-),score=155.74 PLAT3979.2:60-1490(-)